MNDTLTRTRSRTFLIQSMAVLQILAFPPFVLAEDIVEFLNGAKITGTVTEIRKGVKEFDLEVKLNGRRRVRTYGFDKVHAVTFKGKRYVLTTKSVIDGSEGDRVSRSQDDVRKLIEQVGSTPPDWLEATPLKYPGTLDLSWPLKPPSTGWDAQKNVGHYLWSVINENPKRWHSGIKLVHHCMSLHENDKKRLSRDMETLGGMYFELLQDYPRAAFWYQHANPPVNRMSGVQLAECYYRLGNRDMALDMMRGKMLSIEAIKLLGDMDEIDAALQVARVYSKSSLSNQAFLHCGNALRQAGRTDEAIMFYERVLNSLRFRNEEYEVRLKGRARDGIESIRVFDQFDLKRVASGTYEGDAIGYNGRLDVEIRVESGRIESVKILSHKEKQFYAAMTDTPNQIIRKQSVTDVDATSGATVTSQAIVNAAAKALSHGAEG